jgi:hypothetical protein
MTTIETILGTLLIIAIIVIIYLTVNKVKLSRTVKDYKQSMDSLSERFVDIRNSLKEVKEREKLLVYSEGISKKIFEEIQAEYKTVAELFFMFLANWSTLIKPIYTVNNTKKALQLNPSDAKGYVLEQLGKKLKREPANVTFAIPDYLKAKYDVEIEGEMDSLNRLIGLIVNNENLEGAIRTLESKCTKDTNTQ